MPRYVLAYHGGDKPKSPEEGAKNMAEWQAWLGSLGEAVINPGTPLSGTRTVSSDGVEPSSSTMSGFTVVEADSIDAAVEMAQSSPFLKTNGTIDVSEVMELPGSKDS
ncbi:MAG: YciI family protein [Woeseiaceae bacterium]|nr:YciI family protein [Woeseiaceae bacterium]